MQIDLITNISDAVTFFLVAPEIIGEETLNRLNHFARFYMRYTNLRIPHQDLAKDALPDIDDTLHVLVPGLKSQPIWLVAYAIWAGKGLVSPHPWTLVAAWSGFILAVAIGLFGATILILAVLVLLVGNRKISRVLVIVGSTLFLATRALAIWGDLHHAG